MHVFLTGDRGVGKSFALRRTAELSGLPCAGFRTRFLTRENGASALYMVPALQEDLLDEAHIVAWPENGRMRGLTERFDTLGAALLREARQRPGALILMDECGHLERDALAFQAEIRACLDGDNPVLGVLRKGQAWHSFITEHPRVRVLTVTEANRDSIPGEALRLLKEN